MTKKPIVSIITPSYNAIQYINSTIESVKNQSFEDWEMIIVDDCSTDGTQQLLQIHKEQDERIKVVYLEENSGAAVARNTALKYASARFIAFLDSDDRWKPEKLERQLSFMREKDLSFTFTAYELMNQEGSLLNKKIAAPAQISYQEMLKNTIIGCLTVMIDREKVGDFRMPNIRTRQDMATWLSILKKGHIAFGLNETLAEYRIGNPSISKNKWKAASMNWFVYRKIEKLNVFMACWCFSHYAFHALMKRI
ncbi:teichuronic acid biosynthesis protein TuaG [Litchfieldia alkalitelluris]|uniref:teichuronic acid biosynthesis protein TuaG n=1 Tax=Litchfieldia alkalitelluris TaxID=304268 RepID=UPI000996EC47|nr:glycosyltransferase family 2 protein [Litchfieldia alkalitelluris]